MMYIRADANKEIATGHVMRCMAIADKLKKKNCDTVFITADQCAKEFINSRGYDTICLNTIWNNMDTETDKMLKLIKDRNIKTLLIDSYFVTRDYMSRVGSTAKVFYIDDLNMFEYPVHTIINYNIYADKFDYEIRYRKAGINTRFLLGCKYMPLRAEFENIVYNVRDKVSDILITTGGTDSINIAGRLAEKLAQTHCLQGINVHIAVGAYNKNREFFEVLRKKNKNIMPHYNVREMAKLMTECDIAVSAGGTTLYELCACRVPTVAMVMADNQIENVNGFKKKGLVIYGGDIRYGAENILCEITSLIKKLINNFELRKELSQRMRDMGIQNGADMIGEELLSSMRFS